MSDEQVQTKQEHVCKVSRADQSRRRLRSFALGAGAIVLLALAVYWPALNGGFVWDDPVLVQKNPLVKGELTLRTIWFGADFPLANVGLGLEWLVWGKRPAGYHVVNVLLHAASAVLLWRVLARLRIPGAWLAGALFAVHPVCVGSVAWISELKNVLSLPLLLLSFAWYLDFEADAAQEERPRLKYWLSLGAFLLALMSKTSVVMVPFVLLASAWWRRGRVARRDFLLAGPFFALSLLFGLLSIWFQAHQAITGTTVQTENFWGRLAGAGWALWFYLGKALVPLSLCAVYPRWKIDSSALLSYVPLLVWVAGLAVCGRSHRGWGRGVLFSLGCFTVMLFPALGLFDMYFMVFSRVSDHFAYVALTAVVALVAAGLSLALRPAALRVASVVLLAALSVLTVKRAGIYASDESLWRDTLAKNPTEWNANNNFACLLAEQQNLEAAIEHFTASLKSNPDNAQAHGNLAQALALKGHFAEAEPHFHAALKLKPKEAATQKAYASALAAQGRMTDALRFFRMAVRVQPDVGNRLEYASAVFAAGDLREAIVQYRKVLAAQPDMPEVLNNLAWILAASADATLRNEPEAVKLAERACRLKGDADATAFGTLGVALAGVGRFADAIVAAQKAVDLATKSGNTQFAAVNQQLIALYRAGKAYHDWTPPPVPGRSR